MEGDEEEMVSSPELPYDPEDITVLDDEFEGRLSAVSNSSLNLDEDEDDDEIMILNNNNRKEEDPDEDTDIIALPLPPSHHGGYSPVSSEKRSETDVEEGEIFLPNLSREAKKKEEPPLLQLSPSKTPKHRKKRKKEPLDVEMSKHFSKHSDLPRYDVRNIIKFKKKKRSSTLSLRKPSSPRRPSSPPPPTVTRHHRRRRAHSSPEARSSPPRERRNRRSRSREKVRRSNSKNRTSRSKDRQSRSRDKRSRSRELDRRSRSREKDTPSVAPVIKKKRKKASSSNNNSTTASATAATSSTTTTTTTNALVSSTPVKVPKSSKKTKKSLSEKKKASKKSSSSLKTPITIVNSHTSSVADKEVFTAGDKIMVSVNFKPSRVKAPHPISMKEDETILSLPLQQQQQQHRNQMENNANISSNSLLSDTKKPVVIDVMSSPYLVIEPSPQETIDILSDEEGGGGGGGVCVTSASVVSCGITSVTCTVGSSSSSNSNNSCISSSSNPINNAGVGGGCGGGPGGTNNMNPVTSSTTNGNGLSLSSAPSLSLSNLAISSSPPSPPSPQTPPPLSSAPTQSTAASSSSNAVPTAIIDILHHRGPCTPPIEESIDVAKGPQTPSDHSYDPCNPTLSPTCDEDLEPDDFHVRDNGVSSSQNNWSDSDENSKEGAPNSSIPFFDSGSFFSSSNTTVSTVAASSTLATTTTSTSFGLEKIHKDSSKELDVGGAAKDYSTVDMDMDSPFSPQSSDMSDIFEPPLNTPLTNKLLQKRSKSKLNSKSVSKKLSASTSSISNNNNNNNNNNVNNNNNNNKTPSKSLHSKSVQMKLIDDKFRIVDDVPTSAVEMAVKEKFLKKVQRQERIVEEIKMVLKPYYNRKKIDKESYKDILRKCVPKVCHSKNGEINPIKIQKLVKGYIRKYKYHCKNKNKGMKG